MNTMNSEKFSSNIGLYIHWPFCLSKCPYCDFNSHVVESVDHRRWEKALINELRFLSRNQSQKKPKSIFFGGGTPSLMKPETVFEAIQAAKINSKKLNLSHRSKFKIFDLIRSWQAHLALFFDLKHDVDKERLKMKLLRTYLKEKFFQI